MELTEVLYERGDDGVATITLNRPEQRNPLGPQMLRDLGSALQSARDDSAVRAVVLTGAGDRAFCAGADLSSFAADATEVERHLERGAFVELFLACRRLGKPLLGCINGHALAGGFGLALSCDLLVCADTATFGTPEIRVGVWPMMIMSIVTRNLGRKRALELFMTGARIDAATALQWGFVNRVVPAAAVRERTHAWAAEIAAWSPLIMHLGRDAFYATESLDQESALRYLQAQLTVVSMTEDFREGVTAFLEKRAPHFRGR
ncbi:MAG TPA: enoyl-CoA hydratase/isomerase family protein [Candidatus Dormibacteraeota bacterium]|jgi:enoyl-CoA hydratase/carnithine racemase|nr:enoyl-CoA hydratase/isomerase family protein [Candidatus Dormibacteraeota bacterium]